MSALERLLVGVVLAVLLATGAWLDRRHHGNDRYQAGYDAAVAAGKEARNSAEVANFAIGSGLRAQLLDRDTAAFRKEQEYASNLADAQRRVRTGDDRLRCPAASPVQPASAGRRSTRCRRLQLTEADRTLCRRLLTFSATERQLQASCGDTPRSSTTSKPAGP